MGVCAPPGMFLELETTNLQSFRLTF